MRSVGSIFFACGFAFIMLAIPSQAQRSAADTGMRDSAIHNTRQQYVDFIGISAPLYSSPEYVEYYRQLTQGHPYFLNTKFNEGSVMYDHILYENILLKYDLLQSKILLTNIFYGTFCQSPVFDRISYFTILDHRFIKLEKDTANTSIPRTGFYEVLYRSPNLTLLKKETKKIEEDLNDKSGARRFVVSSVNYYIKKRNLYYPFNKKRSVMDVLKDRKNELRLFIRKNNLDFEEGFEKTLLGIVDYYDSLTK